MEKKSGIKAMLLYIVEFLLVAGLTFVLVQNYLGYAKALEDKELAITKLELLTEEIATKTATTNELLDSNSMMAQQLEEAKQVVDKLKLINSDYVTVDVKVVGNPSDTVNTIQVTLTGDIGLGYEAVKSIVQPGTCINSYTIVNGEKPELSLTFNVKK